MLSNAKLADSPTFLEDFVFVPDSTVRVNESCILALYRNSGPERLYALAMYAAACGPHGCEPKDLVGYFVFDAAV